MQALPPRHQKVTKKQLCKDRNCQQCTMASRPLVELASVNGLRWGGEGMGQHRNGEAVGKQSTYPGLQTLLLGAVQSP